MKLNIIAFFITISTNIYAQEMSCKQKVNKLLVDKIKSYKSNDLIPYYSEKDNKWGFFHRITKQKITKPILRDAVFFRPQLNLYYDLETNGKENGCKATILGSKEKYQIIKVEESDYRIYSEQYKPEYKEPYINFINDNITGFQVNEIGKITYFNSKFYNALEKKPFFGEFAIKFKTKYYAIISQKNNDNNYSYSIIDQNGNTMPGFENLKNYPESKFSYKDEDDLWFLIGLGNEKFKFKSLINNKELNEIFDYPYNWYNFSQTIGYAILKVNKVSGLIDLTTMQWKIKPSLNNDFSYLSYCSLEKLSDGIIEDDSIIDSKLEIPIDVIHKNRLKSYVYIQNSKNQFYDLNLKLHLPKK
jgi:hypothetical protein